MAYHTLEYLFLFLPMVLVAYQLVPRKARWCVLLLAGYSFFWMISGKLIVFLLVSTLLTYGIGIWLGHLKENCAIKLEGTSKEERKNIKEQYKKKERLVLVGGILCILSALVYLKYYNFFAQNANSLLQTFHSDTVFTAKNLILPIGISFYTLQAIGYLVDVYWKKIPAERDPRRMALFLGFFPQIMEGPISMYTQTTDSLWEGDPLKGTNLSRGGIRILWGLFKKLIIADRLYILVQVVFENYQQYSGVIVAAAAVAYTIQLYMEFSGTMDIVIGSGLLFGVDLPENFRQPFASKNAAEFWRRWHITLGVWFKNYIFYPVSASHMVKKWTRFGKKHLGNHMTKIGVSAMALFPVWLCNGLWHGPRWSYIFYGMYYFVLILMGIVLDPARDKVIKTCRINENALYWRIPQTIKIWTIIFVGELFFRANGLRAGMYMFASMFQNFSLQPLWDGTFLGFGLDLADYLAIGVGCIVVAIVGGIKERNLLGDRGIAGFRTPVRWAVYYGLILAVAIFGAYGPGYQQVDLIYAEF